MTHPAGFNTGAPSVAAVVCNLDRYMGKFASEILLQGPRVELIVVRMPTTPHCISSAQLRKRCHTAAVPPMLDRHSVVLLSRADAQGDLSEPQRERIKLWCTFAQILLGGT